jgi:hypothetical protein
VWTSRASPADNYWKSVTFGNGLFVAVAYSGIGDRVMTSPDGIVWTSQASAADNGWMGVTFGNGLFVAVAFTGSGDRVMTSNCLANSTSTVTTIISAATTSTTTSTNTTTTITATTITFGEVKCGSGSANYTNPGTNVLAVLAALTFISAIALLVLVMRNRNLVTRIMHLRHEPRGNCRETVLTTSNPLHQGNGNTYEVPVVGQEAIYAQAKFDKAAAAFDEPYEVLDSGA